MNGELILYTTEDGGATVKQDLIVRREGNRAVRRSVHLYNLEMVLAVAYRVRSYRGTQLRQWATSYLREFLVKGFMLDDRPTIAISTSWSRHPQYPVEGEINAYRT